MARVLIVGCGCRGQQLARALRERGHLVRGTTRTADRREAIEAAGAAAAIADPDRLGPLLPHLDGVGGVCWLAGGSPRVGPLAGAPVGPPLRGAGCGPGAPAGGAGGG